MSSDNHIVYNDWCKRMKDSNSRTFSKMTEQERKSMFFLDCYECLKMALPKDFADYFFLSLDESRKVDPFITKTAVFDRLNATWERVTGETRYLSYDSFRRRNKRHE